MDDGQLHGDGNAPFAIGLFHALVPVAAVFKDIACVVDVELGAVRTGWNGTAPSDKG